LSTARVPDRPVPPSDIEPLEFFTRWLPESVAADAERRERLGDTVATLQFDLVGEGGGSFLLHVEGGFVRGALGPAAQADLRLELDIATWRALNDGTLSAPEAFFRRRLRVQGSFALALKLQLIIG
jgi:putative sterol carrier protein